MNKRNYSNSKNHNRTRIIKKNNKKLVKENRKKKKKKMMKLKIQRQIHITVIYQKKNMIEQCIIRINSNTIKKVIS